MQETRNTFDALDWKCHVKRPLRYSGYCCLGLFGGGGSTEITIKITIKNDRHVTVIFFYVLHSSLLFIAPCAALLPSPLREGGIKSAKLGTKLIGTYLISGNAPENVVRMVLLRWETLT